MKRIAAIQTDPLTPGVVRQDVVLNSGLTIQTGRSPKVVSRALALALHTWRLVFRPMAINISGKTRVPQRVNPDDMRGNNLVPHCT
jgi:hypothetical protein